MTNQPDRQTPSAPEEALSGRLPRFEPESGHGDAGASGGPVGARVGDPVDADATITPEAAPSHGPDAPQGRPDGATGPQGGRSGERAPGARVAPPSVCRRCHCPADVPECGHCNACDIPADSPADSPALARLKTAAAQASAGAGLLAMRTVRSVHRLRQQWLAAGPPPLGTSVSRWWDARLIELSDVLAEAIDPNLTEAVDTKED